MRDFCTRKQGFSSLLILNKAAINPYSCLSRLAATGIFSRHAFARSRFLGRGCDEALLRSCSEKYVFVSEKGEVFTE